MRQFIGSPTQVSIPTTLSCPHKTCGQEWEVVLRFDMPGWYCLPDWTNETCCPVCRTPGRLKRGEEK